MAGNAIRISILANAKQANQEVDSFSGKLKKFGAKAGAALATAGVAAGAAVGAFAVASIKSASDAQQSMGATETVFGKAAAAIVKNSKKASSAVGLSANEYRESANVIGALFSNKGLKGNELAKQTDAVIKKGADLSATFGGSAKEAVEALGSAFKGEFDPLERYGISLNASTINAAAGALAQKKYGKSLDALSAPQQDAIKRQATQNEINRQSVKTTGAFAKESDTLAHKQQVLGAKFEDVKAKIGTALLPVATKFIGFLADKFLPATEKAGSWLADKLGPAAKKVGGWFKREVNPMIERFGNYVKTDIIPEVKKLWKRLNEGGGTMDKLKAGFKVTWAFLKNVFIPIVADLYKDHFKRLFGFMDKVGIPVIKALGDIFLFLGKVAINQFDIIINGAALAFGWVPGIGGKLKKAAEGFNEFKTEAEKAFAELEAAGNASGTKSGGATVKGFGAGFVAGAPGATEKMKAAASASINSTNKTADKEASKGGKKTSDHILARIASTFRQIPGKATRSIGGVTRTLVSKGKDLFSGMSSGLSTRWRSVSGYLRGTGSRASGAVGRVTSSLSRRGSELFAGLRSGLGSRWTSVRGYLGGLGSRARSAVGSTASSLTSRGSSLFQGLWNGLQSKWTSIQSWVSGKLSWLAGNFPASPIKHGPLKKVFNDGRAGKKLMEMLATGIKEGGKYLDKTLDQTLTLEAQVSARGAGAAAAVPNINVTVNAPVGSNPADIGRELQKFLDSYFISGGRRRAY